MCNKGLNPEVLEQADHPVEFDTRRAEVLRQVAGRTIDVLIVEVHLPDMKVWELIPQVHQLSPTLPIIAISADDS